MRGVVGYVLYSAVIFAFEIAFNRLFLVYVGVFGLALFALPARLGEGDLPRSHISSAPRVSVSIYLLVLAALFPLAWLGELVPAMIANTTPKSIRDAGLPSNPVYVLDLGTLIPLFVLAALGLLRHRPGGAILAGALLALNALLSLSIVASTFSSTRRMNRCRWPSSRCSPPSRSPASGWRSGACAVGSEPHRRRETDQTMAAPTRTCQG